MDYQKNCFKWKQMTCNSTKTNIACQLLKIEAVFPIVMFGMFSFSLILDGFELDFNTVWTKTLAETRGEEGALTKECHSLIFCL
jgi:hypothetical protein